MLVCSNVNFLTFWMCIRCGREIALGLEVSINGRRVTESVVPLVIHVFPAGKSG